MEGRCNNLSRCSIAPTPHRVSTVCTPNSTGLQRERRIDPPPVADLRSTDGPQAHCGDLTRARDTPVHIFVWPPYREVGVLLCGSVDVELATAVRSHLQVKPLLVRVRRQARATKVARRGFQCIADGGFEIVVAVLRHAPWFHCGALAAGGQLRATGICSGNASEAVSCVQTDNTSRGSRTVVHAPAAMLFVTQFTVGHQITVLVVTVSRVGVPITHHELSGSVEAKHFRISIGSVDSPAPEACPRWSDDNLGKGGGFRRRAYPVKCVKWPAREDIAEGTAGAHDHIQEQEQKESGEHQERQYEDTTATKTAVAAVVEARTVTGPSTQ
jgi:hypothetical protein